MMEPFPQADLGQHFGRNPGGLSPVAIPDERRHHDVLKGRELGQEVVELEHEPHALVAGTGRSCHSRAHRRPARRKAPCLRWAARGPPRVWRKVLLPTPDAPTMASISPFPISRSMPSSTWSDSGPLMKVLRSCCIMMSGVLFSASRFIGFFQFLRRSSRWSPLFLPSSP